MLQIFFPTDRHWEGWEKPYGYNCGYTQFNTLPKSQRTSQFSKVKRGGDGDI